MNNTYRYLALAVFLLYSVGVSAVNGFNYVGDVVEKLLSGFSMLSTFFVLPALLAIFRQVDLFRAKELIFLSWVYAVLVIASYIYPMIIYWDQGPAEFLDMFFYDAIITIVVFVLLRRAAGYVEKS
ncbi:hypothetical protein [Vibrio proteolyticus]